MSHSLPFWKSFEHAWNAHDATSVAAHFEDNASLTFIDGRQFAGRSSIRVFYHETFATMPSDWVHSVLSETISGSTSHGELAITAHKNGAEIMTIDYDLQLSNHGLIRKLILRK